MLFLYNNCASKSTREITAKEQTEIKLATPGIQGETDSRYRGKGGASSSSHFEKLSRTFNSQFRSFVDIRARISTRVCVLEATGSWSESREEARDSPGNREYEPRCVTHSNKWIIAP